jgi:tetratricopeptide (TPR) repeat protein
VLYQIISDDPIPVLTLNPELPARVAAVIHRMLEKDPERRYANMEEVARDVRAAYESLRRSRGRSAVAAPVAPGGEETRLKIRDHLARGRAHFDAGRFAQAVEEMQLALALDPDCDEAVEILWRAGKPLRGSRSGPPPRDPASAARIEALLLQAAPGRPEEQARRALMELALIAPDDPRVSELVKERASGDRAR